MCKKSEQAEPMPSIAYASSLTRQLALPAMPGEGQKAAISRAWRRLVALKDRDVAEWTWSRVRDLWIERESIRVWEDEVRDLERANKLRERAVSEQKIEKAASDELRELHARLDRLEALLFAQDQDFHSDQVHAMRSAVRESSVLGRSVASPEMTFSPRED